MAELGPKFDEYDEYDEHHDPFRLIGTDEIESMICEPASPKRRVFLEDESKDVLTTWISGNLDKPFPKHSAKVGLARDASLSLKQVEDYFRNYRRRKWGEDLKDRLLVSGVPPPARYKQYPRPKPPKSSEAA